VRHAPIVSVIIPVHNQETYIGRSIRSALNQTFPEQDMEIIVVNDGSTDRTRYALDLFRDDIRIIDHATCRGLPASLNSGIREARGRLVVRLDADDYVHCEYVNVLSLHLLMNECMDAVACDYQWVDDREQVTETRSCVDHPIGCGIMFRIENLVDLGLYDEGMKVHEDKDLRLRFLERYEIHRIALPLYRYRRHDSNMTNDAGRSREYMHRLEAKHGLHP
jgi:glycosyltransferase involved in cell wall biosynthesis